MLLVKIIKSHLSQLLLNADNSDIPDNCRMLPNMMSTFKPVKFSNTAHISHRHPVISIPNK